MQSECGEDKRMLALNTMTHPQPGLSEHQEVNPLSHYVAVDKAITEQWKNAAKQKREAPNRAFFFMYQMKLLNTLGLVKSVCRPWGTLPHGNDFAYHFHKIATTNSVALLQCYESVFRTIYDRFDAEAADPENAAASLWAKVEDVDYFKVIYRLECMRNNNPFDNNSYNEVLEKTVNNVDLQFEIEQTQGISNFDELPSWEKFNWESKNRQYSLSAFDEETALPSDVDMDIAAAFQVAEQYEDEFDNSDLIDTTTNTIEFDEGYFNDQSDGNETIMETVSNNGRHAYNTRNQNEFDKLVMHVISKPPRAPPAVHATRQARNPRPAAVEQRLTARQRSVSRRASVSYKDDEDFVTELSTRTAPSRRRDEDARKKRKRRGEAAHTGEAHVKAPASARPDVAPDFVPEDPHVNRNINVVSASVSYDKRQQRFMAQWKTREGTKHSKSFYAKRYASPLLARKHAELYKMYILQHRGKVTHDMVEPTYEQLAAQNFQALDDINISDVAFMEDME
ncbi:NADPH--cytochrome P450 reductase [Babesia caballi]|uniref:NADPH--cytochrome P450 reductase n=1 Tax=Babesia caballi TaxID=5871 RepID=A0AAV4LV86_BABCB|nr:NADPH--cytochrome P450 reductase [Babesia caballi]